MEQWMQTILQISLTTAVVIGILLMLIPVWRQRYSARWRKVIWLVIAVRLLVPFSIELPAAPVQMDLNMERVVAIQTSPISQTYGEGETVTPTDNTNSPIANTPAIGTTIEKKENVTVWNQGMILFVIWLLGMGAFVLWYAVQYLLFQRKVMTWLQPLEDHTELLHRAGEELQLKKYPSAAVSNLIQGPMLVGFIKPVILLPERIYSENELVMILRHELVHYKQHDLWYKLILLAANAVHWFNPMVWLMVRQANKDIEQVCDDIVVAGKDIDYRKAYSMTLLNTMASQRGVALSTYLSKDAQNVKNRFAAILQPKQYKRGIALLCVIVLLAVGISGCLQIGNDYDGENVYERVAPFLPENAIHDPSVYQLGGEKDDIDYVIYEWKEERIPGTEVPAEDSDIEIGWKYEDTKLYKRGLMIFVSKEDDSIIHMIYDGDDYTESPVKPAEIGRDAAQREAYVKQIASALIDNGESLVFCESWTKTDDNGNVVKGSYTHGTRADLDQYEITLNYQHGYMEEFMHIGKASSGMFKVTRYVPIMVEGLEETVDMTLNRQPDYYAMYTDPTMFSTRLSGIAKDGSFCDEYVLRGGDESALVQSYMRVGFSPDCTMDEWLELVQTDSDYVKYAPQINPLSSSWPTKWEDTDELKVFPDDPVRQWKVLKAARDGAINYCYLTPYRDGVMAAIISYPSSSEYAEGMGARMHAMMDTLVLASRGDIPWVEETNATLWDYTGYLDAYSGWESQNGKTPFYADYDGDGKKDRVYRKNIDDEYSQYQIEFANGEVQPLGRVSNIGYPSIEAADLTGDGKNEIIFQVSYPTSTNPVGVGDLIVSRIANKQENGGYTGLDWELQSEAGRYDQRLPVHYKTEGEAVVITVPGTDFRQELPFTEETWKYGVWQSYYPRDYADIETQTNAVWAYRLEEHDGITQMVCNLQLFDKWSECGLNVTLAYDGEALVIDDIQFCEDLYEEWV